MKLSLIFENIEAEIVGDDLDISGLYHNSKEVKEGGLFFCIDGTNVDGNAFAVEALQNGAIAIVSSKKTDLSGVAVVYVKDVRLAMSLAAANFYGNPSKDMQVLGVTGTNGKTTTTFMLEAILKEAGKKVGIIGTSGSFIEGRFLESSLTTPDPINLQKILGIMRDNNVDVVCMEVSAHALELSKIRGVMTDIALFTNLTEDHLDFFKDMQNYKRAKESFFMDGYAKNAVINIDDDFGAELAEKVEIPFLTYSRRSQKIGKADIIAGGITHNNLSQSFVVSTPLGQETITLNMAGNFNISNALGAIGASLLLGIDLETIKNGLEKLKEVEGRFNCYCVRGVKVIIDYAHTPDGLKNLLLAARELTSQKLFVVFGCGGNRDPIKRPIMGKIAEKLADYVIITNDNPRFEDPKDIAKAIASGIEGDNYLVKLDREKAIKLAIKKAKNGDVVVIAGKGAEDYIDIMGKKLPYSDKKVVKSLV